jgi:hypothetical protein
MVPYVQIVCIHSKVDGAYKNKKKLFRLGYICCQHLAWQCVAVRTWRLVLKFLAAWLSDGLDSLLFLESLLQSSLDFVLRQGAQEFKR